MKRATQPQERQIEPTETPRLATRTTSQVAVADPSLLRLCTERTNEMKFSKKHQINAIETALAQAATMSFEDAERWLRQELPTNVFDSWLHDHTSDLQCPNCGSTNCKMEVSPEDGGEQVRCADCGKVGR